MLFNKLNYSHTEICGALYITGIYLNASIGMYRGVFVIYSNIKKRAEMITMKKNVKYVLTTSNKHSTGLQNHFNSHFLH